MSFTRVIIVAVVLLGSHPSVHAQDVQLKGRTGLGLSLPLYDSGEGTENKIGWAGIGGLEYNLRPNVGLFIEGYYARHRLEIDEFSYSGEGISLSFPGVSGSLSVRGANAGIVLLQVIPRCLQCYGIVGAGYGQATVNMTLLDTDLSDDESGLSDDESGLSIVVGAGIRYPVNDRIELYVEGRYSDLFVDGGDFDFLPVTAGFVLSF